MVIHEPLIYVVMRPGVKFISEVTTGVDRVDRGACSPYFLKKGGA